jgi:hypothetical protein
MESTRAAAHFLRDAPCARKMIKYAMHQNAAPAQQNEEQFKYLQPGDSASTWNAARSHKERQVPVHWKNFHAEKRERISLQVYMCVCIVYHRQMIYYEEMDVARGAENYTVSVCIKNKCLWTDSHIIINAARSTESLQSLYISASALALVSSATWLTDRGQGRTGSCCIQ